MTDANPTTLTVQRKRRCTVCGKRKPASGWGEDEETFIGKRLRFLTRSTICQSCLQAVKSGDQVPGANAPAASQPTETQNEEASVA